MLDIKKELEKFNRLLEEVDETEERPKPPGESDGSAHHEPEVPEDAGRYAHAPEPEQHSTEPSHAEPASSAGDAHRNGEPPVSRSEATEPASSREMSSAAENSLEDTETRAPDETRHVWTVVEQLHPDVPDAEAEDVGAVQHLDAISEQTDSGEADATPREDDASSLFTPPAPAAFDSLMKGAKSALSDTHRPKPKAKPPVTVTLPSADELEEDVERERSFRERIVPLITSKVGTFPDLVSGILEERLGTVVAVATTAVVILAGLVIGPRLMSGGDGESEALASVQADSDSVHLLSSADNLVSETSARLSVSSFPPGARVYLGAELIGVTPFRGITVDRGLNSVSIRKADYVSVDTMLTLEGSSDLFFELPADLTPQVASETEDGDGTSLSEGVPQANRQTSVAAPTISDEPVTEVRTQKSVSQPDPSVASARAASGEVSRTSTGSVVITSDPAGATVFIDDESVGQTPLTLNDVTAGRSRITMQREGYVPYEIELNVMPALQTPFHAVLAPMKGRIQLRAEGGADLYVDGALVQRSIQPGYLEVVDVGEHTIGLIHPTYGEWSTRVTVRADETAQVEVSLEEEAYRSAVADGDRLFSESQYAEAIESYNRALTIRPGVQVIENKIGLAAKAMAESDVRATDVAGVYTVVDTPPQLVGGLEALHANVQYPQEAYDAGVQGRVYVQFVVDENGRARDIKIAKGLPMGCNEAAIRAVERARFTPGLVDGRPVKTRHTVFVNFTIG